MPRLLLRAASLLTAVVTAGCTVATPFRGPMYQARSGVVAPGPTVHVAITHAVLDEDRRLRRAFWSHVGKVADALPGQTGYVGHSRRRNLAGSEAWTMTVWTDEESLDAFASSDVHLAAIQAGGAALRSFRSARAKLFVDEVPISWQRALAILAADEGASGGPRPVRAP